MRKTLYALAAASALASGAAHATIDNYVAYLLGANQVGAPGDPDGFGLASVSIDEATDLVSWSIIANNIDTPITGAHIHEGAAGTNGPIVIDFDEMLTGSTFASYAENITPATASGFYVNVHNPLYPAGAIRGQLQYVGSISAPVPEPATTALWLLGLAGLGAAATHRRQAKIDA